jgi:hypothetical protein
MKVFANLTVQVSEFLTLDNGTRFLNMAYEEVGFPTLLCGKKKYCLREHKDAKTINFGPAKPMIRGIESIKQGQTMMAKKGSNLFMNTMMDMVKGNVAMYVPNIAMMSFVGYFFSGFVCLKMPFSMPSTHFKVMLQRGVDLSNLDVSYVSSLSWYFMLMFGLNDVYALILGESAEMDEAQVRDAHLPSLSSLLAPADVAVAFLRPPYRQRTMHMQMGMAAQQPGFDAASLYRQEKDLVR